MRFLDRLSGLLTPLLQAPEWTFQRLLGICAAGAVCHLQPQGLRAEVPKLDQLFPAGGARGTTNLVVGAGNFQPWPVEVWIDTPGLTLRPEKEAGKWSAEIASDAGLGPRLIRLYNKEGATELRFFVITAGREVLEVEPNDAWAQAQQISELPVTVNGRLEKNGDIDSFSVSLIPGQWLVASMDAYRLASPMDGLMRLLDPNGRQVAFNHDSRVLDPFLAWQGPTAGTYTLQVMAFPHPATASVNFAGGSAYVYRLALTTGPYASKTLPLAARTGERREMRVEGWNFPAGSPSLPIEFEAPKAANLSEECWLQSQAFLSPVRVGLSEDPQFLESSLPIDESGRRTAPVPSGITGLIATAGEEDRYGFKAKKGDRIEFLARSGWFGLPLDAWLKVLDDTGQQVARDDDGAGWGDPRIDWTAAQDGLFTVVVGNLIRRGGPDFLYHLSIRNPKPWVKATVADNHFTLGAGKTNEVKVVLERKNGHATAYTLEAQGLPSWVAAAPVDVAEKAGEAVLQLKAPEDAGPWNGPFELVLRPRSGPEIRVLDELVSTSVNNGVPGGFLDLVVPETPHLWLTVLPKPAEPPPKK